MLPTTIIRTVRAIGAFLRSPSSWTDGGGRNTASRLPTANAPPNASTIQAKRSSPKNTFLKLSLHSIGMGFHHVALATHDTAATHRFYTDLMGFSLVKTVVAPNPGSDGWSRHYFYDTGSDGMIAFWELHDKKIGSNYPTNLNATAGLPGWVNHFAYNAPTREFLDERRAVWCAGGHTVAEVDHEFCISIYTSDPDGNTVEFCHTLREFAEDEKRHAYELMLQESPAADKDAKLIIWPSTAVRATV